MPHHIFLSLAVLWSAVYPSLEHSTPHPPSPYSWAPTTKPAWSVPFLRPKGTKPSMVESALFCPRLEEALSSSVWIWDRESACWPQGEGSLLVLPGGADSASWAIHLSVLCQPGQFPTIGRDNNIYNLFWTQVDVTFALLVIIWLRKEKNNKYSYATEHYSLR